MARVVMMGTPEFAVPSLEALHQAHRVVGVVTQPDRPAGRGRQVIAPPLKQAALALGLEVFQPDSLRPPEAVARVSEWQPDVIVVAAFGQLLLPNLLDLPPHGCLNVHASLLPLYRGAAPIPAAILAGDERTGVTIMQMDEGLDTGPILTQAGHPIGVEDTTGTLTADLAVLGARLLLATLPAWLEGRIQPRPQDTAAATYCRALEKEDGALDWSRPAIYLERQVRACAPWPGAFTTWRGQRLKVNRARLASHGPAGALPGQVVDLRPGCGVVTGQGLLELLEVQLAGKTALDVAHFSRGHRDFVGSQVGV